MNTATLIEPTIVDETRTETIPPYKVILLDDPVTTMAFVVWILMRIFKKDAETAQQIMLEIHTSGSAHAATLSLEQAELKQDQVHRAAQSASFPFRCIVEAA